VKARTVKRLAVCGVLGLASSLGAAWGFKFFYILVGSAPTTFTCVDDTGEWHVSHWRAPGRRSYTLTATGWQTLFGSNLARLVTPATAIAGARPLYRDDASAPSLAGPLGPEVPTDALGGGEQAPRQELDTVATEILLSEVDAAADAEARQQQRELTYAQVAEGSTLQFEVLQRQVAIANQRRALSITPPGMQMLTVPPSRYTETGTLPDWVRRPPAQSTISQLATGAYGWPLVCLKGELEVYPAPTGRTREVYPCSLVISLDWSPRGMRFTMPLRVLWEGLAVDWAVHAGLWALPLVLLPAARSARWRRAGKCPGCGYELEGKFGGGCPECGWGRAAAEAAAR
jgi:hypothetical protein